ncbi:peptidase domain-containing ABC transporter [Novispirillum itersonii]|uniref:ATP-binding cassette subfamily C protein LapB n=1 Tax=Novispirillum itersonii TaxID=189 RepID=A0A7W9ZG25_NOVIT|nr:ATP-binding cassette domain-containing protein [Novispirillum itersonii]MBB6210560.1 ATP-binding cassette subfamily C protein LapB [Novispirillum itersonii]
MPSAPPQSPAPQAAPAAGSWLETVLRPLLPVTKDLLAASLFINILALAGPIFVMQVYDRVVYQAGLSTLTGLVIGMAVVVLFDFTLRQMRARVMQGVAVQVDVTVGRRLFHKVLSLPLRSLESRPTAAWQQIFQDIEVLRNCLSGPTVVLLFDLPFTLLFLGLIFVIAMPVAWVLVGALVAYVVIAALSARAVGSAADKERKRQISRDVMMAETVMGRTTVKALAMERGLLPLWEDRQADAIERSLERGHRSDRFVNMALAVTTLTTVLMTTVGALSIVDQKMSIGALVAANMLSGRMIGPFNQLVGAWRTLLGFRQSARRLGDLFGQPEDRQSSGLALPRPSGLLTAEAVTFRYGRETVPTINAVSHVFRPGGITAIMGRNGCGKTTLLKILLGLYAPESGRVLLDGADLSQFTRAELAGWIGYVPQDCVLFSGSIRDNLTRAHPGIGDDDILEASTLAGAHQYIINLPDGYATDVGEMGSLLSGGIRQRLAIARALMGKPSVLILDEPSGSLDRQAEDHLREVLIKLAQDRTVIIVTHSPALLSACRSIVVMEQGQVAVSGPAGDVMGYLSRKGTPAAPPTPGPQTVSPTAPSAGA